MGKSKHIKDMTGENIIEKIEELLPVRMREKGKFGEVFTPPSLINEMLNKLPKSVWSNKDLKWLDPANGVGNFPMVRCDGRLSGACAGYSRGVRSRSHNKRISLVSRESSGF